MDTNINETTVWHFYQKKHKKVIVIIIKDILSQYLFTLPFDNPHYYTQYIIYSTTIVITY